MNTNGFVGFVKGIKRKRVGGPNSKLGPFLNLKSGGALPSILYSAISDSLKPSFNPDSFLFFIV